MGRVTLKQETWGRLSAHLGGLLFRRCFLLWLLRGARKEQRAGEDRSWELCLALQADSRLQSQGEKPVLSLTPLFPGLLSAEISTPIPTRMGQEYIRPWLQCPAVSVSGQCASSHGDAVRALAAVSCGLCLWTMCFFPRGHSESPGGRRGLAPLGRGPSLRSGPFHVNHRHQTASSRKQGGGRRAGLEADPPEPVCVWVPAEAEPQAGTSAQVVHLGGNGREPRWAHGDVRTGP